MLSISWDRFSSNEGLGKGKRYQRRELARQQEEEFMNRCEVCYENQGEAGLTCEVCGVQPLCSECATLCDCGNRLCSVCLEDWNCFCHHEEEDASCA